MVRVVLANKSLLSTYDFFFLLVVVRRQLGATIFGGYCLPESFSSPRRDTSLIPSSDIFCLPRDASYRNTLAVFHSHNTQHARPRKNMQPSLTQTPPALVPGAVQAAVSRLGIIGQLPSRSGGAHPWKSGARSVSRLPSHFMIPDL